MKRKIMSGVLALGVLLTTGCSVKEFEKDEVYELVKTNLEEMYYGKVKFFVSNHERIEGGDYIFYTYSSANYYFSEYQVGKSVFGDYHISFQKNLLVSYDYWRNAVKELE